MVEMMLSPSQLQANKFNPNVMQPEEFQALKKDMERVGPKRIDPVLVSLYCDFYPCQDTAENRKAFANCYVIVDGEHRWTGATQLGWPEVRCDVEVLDEEEAKGICYRKNKDRGTIDPFKEAALFQSELELLNQKEIADKFLVDPSTVSHRLSLLKLVPEIKEQISKMPRGTITPSHLEPIATLPEDEQKKFALIGQWNKQARSVQDITEEVKRTKRELAEKDALKKAVDTAKFPKCPKCGAEPAGASYGNNLPWVRCSSNSWDHDWNLETGKLEREPVKVSESLDEKKEPQLSSVIRSNFTVKQLGEAFFKSIHAVLPDLESASKISLVGKLNGEVFSIDFSSGPNGMSVSVSHGSRSSQGLSFRAEPKDYQSGHKSKIDVGCWKPKQEDLDQCAAFIDNAFKNVLLPLPEKKKAAAIAEDLPKIFVYCVIGNEAIEESKSYHHDGKVYCGYHAMLCNVPPLGCDDDALTKKALKEREQLRSEGKVLPPSLPAAVVEVPA